MRFGAEDNVVSRFSAALMLVLAVGLLLLGPHLPGAAREAPPEAEPATSPAATDVRYLVPFTRDSLHPNFTVAETVEGGYGFASPVEPDRPDVWDCLTMDRGILDHCFENPFVLPDEPGKLAWFAAPFDIEVVMLTLTGPLVRQKAPALQSAAPSAAAAPLIGADGGIRGEDLPWGMELANGDRDALLRGTLMVIAGETASDGCANGGCILGTTNRDQPL